MDRARASGRTTSAEAPRIANRNSPPAVLLRESCREGGKVKSRTFADISHWPEAKIDSRRRALAGERFAYQL
jgi:hypothetical protein